MIFRLYVWTSESEDSSYLVGQGPQWAAEPKVIMRTAANIWDSLSETNWDGIVMMIENSFGGIYDPNFLIFVNFFFFFFFFFNNLTYSVTLNKYSLTHSMAYGTRIFNASFTRTLQLSLSWTESTPLLVLIHISLRSVLLRLALPKGLFPVGVSVKILKALLPSSILAIWPANHIIDIITLKSS